MGSIPDFHYRLPSRRAGAFGSSPAGQFAEFVTLTWFRLEAFVIWLLLIPILLIASSQSFGGWLVTLLVSPAFALAFWGLLKLTGWVFYFVPVMGKVWAVGRLIFLWTFSRLVVQRAPEIDMPAWH